MTCNKKGKANSGGTGACQSHGGKRPQERRGGQGVAGGQKKKKRLARGARGKRCLTIKRRKLAVQHRLAFIGSTCWPYGGWLVMGEKKMRRPPLLEGAQGTGTGRQVKEFVDTLNLHFKVTKGKTFRGGRTRDIVRRAGKQGYKCMGENFTELGRLS